MPFYVLSSISYLKDNVYKFGYSSKTKEDLLKQYECSKRTIIDPFILEWWNINSSINKEKIIHNILCNNYKNIIKNIKGEWYRCNSLFCFLKTIDMEINKLENKLQNEVDYKKDDNEESKNKDIICEIRNNNIYKYYRKELQILIKYEYILKLFNIKELKINMKYKKEFYKIVFIENDSEYIRFDFLMKYIDNNEIKYLKFKNEIIKKVNYHIKDYILNINILNLKIIINITNLISIKNVLPIIIVSNFVELEEIKIKESYPYINEGYQEKYKDRFDSSSLDYINNNKNLIYIQNIKSLNKLNNSYIIVKKLEIDRINVKITFKDNKEIELSVDEYKKYVKKNIDYKHGRLYGQKSIIDIYNENIIKTTKILHYSFKIAILNNINDTNFSEEYYLLDLENDNLAELIINDDIFSSILLYTEEKLIRTHKYILYQLFYNEC